MRSWTGIALARTSPGGDGMRSRLSTYLHPLAGRPLVWHSLSALAAVRPEAKRLLLIGSDDLNSEILVGLFPELQVLRNGDQLPELEADRVLVIDAAAPALGGGLSALLDAPDGTRFVAPDGSIAAAVVTREVAGRLVRSEAGLDALADGASSGPAHAVEHAMVVRDRCALARAGRLIQDRIVERLMVDGATFLLPETVLVDADVRIGRDTIIYPGVVLEGQTVIGEETVVGPGCRIIDSWIGSGVELKGWNFISRSSIRNRAILEPYVRRGFE
jgi:hypothetical protein